MDREAHLPWHLRSRTNLDFVDRAAAAGHDWAHFSFDGARMNADHSLTQQATQMEIANLQARARHNGSEQQLDAYHESVMMQRARESDPWLHAERARQMMLQLRQRTVCKDRAFRMGEGRTVSHRATTSDLRTLSMPTVHTRRPSDETSKTSKTAPSSATPTSPAGKQTPASSTDLDVPISPKTSRPRLPSLHLGYEEAFLAPWVTADERKDVSPGPKSSRKVSWRAPSGATQAEITDAAIKSDQTLFGSSCEYEPQRCRSGRQNSMEFLPAYLRREVEAVEQGRVLRRTRVAPLQMPQPSAYRDLRVGSKQVDATSQAKRDAIQKNRPLRPAPRPLQPLSVLSPSSDITTYHRTGRRGPQGYTPFIDLQRGGYSFAAPSQGNELERMLAAQQVSRRAHLTFPQPAARLYTVPEEQWIDRPGLAGPTASAESSREARCPWTAHRAGPGLADEALNHDPGINFYGDLSENDPVRRKGVHFVACERTHFQPSERAGRLRFTSGQERWGEDTPLAKILLHQQRSDTAIRPDEDDLTLQQIRQRLADSSLAEDVASGSRSNEASSFRRLRRRLRSFSTPSLPSMRSFGRARSLSATYVPSNPGASIVDCANGVQNAVSRAVHRRFRPGCQNSIVKDGPARQLHVVDRPLLDATSTLAAMTTGTPSVSSSRVVVRTTASEPSMRPSFGQVAAPTPPDQQAALATAAATAAMNQAGQPKPSRRTATNLPKRYKRSATNTAAQPATPSDSNSRQSPPLELKRTLAAAKLEFLQSLHAAEKSVRSLLDRVSMSKPPSTRPRDSGVSGIDVGIESAGSSDVAFPGRQGGAGALATQPVQSPRRRKTMGDMRQVAERKNGM